MNQYIHIPQSNQGGPVLYANIGGPASYPRKQRINSSILGRKTISSSILGKDDGFSRCPLVMRLCLIFEDGEDPVAVIAGILKREGYTSPEELRGKFSLPEGRLICRPVSVSLRHGGLVVKTAGRDKVLEQALLLGLCTSQIFDPARPVLWTTGSLTRALELFDPAGFYL